MTQHKCAVNQDNKISTCRQIGFLSSTGMGDKEPMRWHRQRKKNVAFPCNHCKIMQSCTCEHMGDFFFFSFFFFGISFLQLTAWHSAKYFEHLGNFRFLVGVSGASYIITAHDQGNLIRAFDALFWEVCLTDTGSSVSVSNVASQKESQHNKVLVTFGVRALILIYASCTWL